MPGSEPESTTTMFNPPLDPTDPDALLTRLRELAALGLSSDQTDPFWLAMGFRVLDRRLTSGRAAPSDWRSSHQPKLTQAPVSNSGQPDRGDQTQFRMMAPRTVAGIWVLQLGVFRPGNECRYASASALTYRPQRPTRAFSTHLLIYNDEQHQWMLSSGHYDLESIQAAQRSLTDRDRDWLSIQQPDSED